ncbi:MAG: septal ring lytic transglycosylase RlpA family protein [Candidatus Komeilibacteria bacterium]
MKSLSQIIIIFTLLICSLFVFQPVQAVDNFSAHLTIEQIRNGANLASNDGIFNISWPAESYTQPIDVYLTTDSAVPNYPAGDIISSVYSYYILSSESASKSFEIAIRFTDSSPWAKHIWLYDYKQHNWLRLPTRLDRAGGLAIASTTHYYGKAVLLSEKVMLYNQGEGVYESFAKDFAVQPDARQLFSEITIAAYNNQLYPEQWPRVSDIYQYELVGGEMAATPFTLHWSYKFVDAAMPTAFYWDNGKQNWISLPTLADLDRGEVIAQTVFPYARVALFQQPNVSAGEASWYAYKNCNCAAVRDYPKGTKLRVTNLYNGKSVIVRVNDYGPEAWTGRIIDLDKIAFAQIASLRMGLTNVKIEALQ